MHRSFLAFLLACATVLPLIPAQAADFVVVTYVGGTPDDNLDYLPGSDNLGIPAIIPAGSTLSYRNLNTGLPHDLVSVTCVQPDGTRLADDYSIGGPCPGDATRLFASETPPGGALLDRVAPVEGVSSLAPGEYTFYCSVHPGDGPTPGPMVGRLVVVG
ncbi:MAG: hypothetical protein ACLGH3_10045 [Actinomycetota bacterium]